MRKRKTLNYMFLAKQYSKGVFIIEENNFYLNFIFKTLSHHTRKIYKKVD